MFPSLQMQLLYGFLILAGFYPLFRAWRANRRSSLGHAVWWAMAAWLAWGVALVAGPADQPGLEPWRYLALCLTAAAGVAVLGARRPQMGAWNFVVCGLLAVMLLPLGESLFIGAPSLGGPRIFFLGAALAMGILNYVPTAVAIPALLLGCIGAGECLVLFSTDLEVGPIFFAVLHGSLLSLPWLALVFWRQPPPENSALTWQWWIFRDRFGLFWGQRLREQFNRGAAHAGLPGFLHWHGWELGKNDAPPTEEQLEDMEAIFQALAKRFFS